MHDSTGSDSYDTEGDVQGSDGSGSGGWALTGGGGGGVARIESRGG